jgi:hypothetical protein
LSNALAHDALSSGVDRTPNLRLEELAVGADQIDQGDRRVALSSAQHGKFVERWLARRIHHRIADQGCAPPRLPHVHGVHFCR